MRLSVRTRAQNALFRHVAAPGRCGATPPARLRGTMENVSTGQMRSSNPPPGCGVGCAGVRKSRLGVWSHGKAHSEALWPSHLTKNRTLAQPAHGKPHSAAVPRSRRDQKAHSATRASRKSAFCNQSLTKTRTLPPPCLPQHGTAPPSPHSSPREWCSKRPFS